MQRSLDCAKSFFLHFILCSGLDRCLFPPTMPSTMDTVHREGKWSVHVMGFVCLASSDNTIWWRTTLLCHSQVKTTCCFSSDPDTNKVVQCGLAVERCTCELCDHYVVGLILTGERLRSNLGQVVYVYVRASVTKQYNLVLVEGRWHSLAGKVTTDLAESNGWWFKVTCGLTVCTPGWALGPTLGNEYGRTLPLPIPLDKIKPSNEVTVSLYGVVINSDRRWMAGMAGEC